ncbi:NAD(P)H-dependent oxidoreductase [Desertivirga arenae]|uniref:NAD(P)H-dependent oxidoreductase n=1 Tax=Desertivirga arenae TaxID=2810309 RepID=UPI001A957D9F|nr:NAD(P)H-dependent oxidoreductase [Pedobacter sp. SYSU D00823]
MNIFIINGGQVYAQAKGYFNKTMASQSCLFFKEQTEAIVQATDINEPYSIEIEIQKFTQADVILYHTSIWWMQLPNLFKKFLDEVLNAGKNKGIWTGDGRSSENPQINYGTGGLLKGRYVVTTSWNAPETAFTLPNEFFSQTSIDHGILYGFHRMNAFIGLEHLGSFHFYDIVKNGDLDRDIQLYREFLKRTFKK